MPNLLKALEEISNFSPSPKAKLASRSKRRAEAKKLDKRQQKK